MGASSGAVVGLEDGGGEVTENVLDARLLPLPDECREGLLSGRTTRPFVTEGFGEWYFGASASLAKLFLKSTRAF